MLTLYYVIRCIFKNECAGEPPRCPMVPVTPFPQCEVVPPLRTPADTEHIILKNCPTKMLTLRHVILCIFETKCAGGPQRCPTVPTTPFPQCEVAPTSRTPTETVHIILKNRPTKMLTLRHVILCIFENKCAGEPLRCPTVPATPFPQCEVAPTSRTRNTYFGKTAPPKCQLSIMLYGAFLKINARVSPCGVQRFQRHHSQNVRLRPLREHPPTRNT